MGKIRRFYTAAVVQPGPICRAVGEHLRTGDGYHPAGDIEQSAAGLSRRVVLDQRIADRRRSVIADAAAVGAGAIAA